MNSGKVTYLNEIPYRLLKLITHTYIHPLIHTSRDITKSDRKITMAEKFCQRICSICVHCGTCYIIFRVKYIFTVSRSNKNFHA